VAGAAPRDGRDRRIWGVAGAFTRGLLRHRAPSPYTQHNVVSRRRGNSRFIADTADMLLPPSMSMVGVENLLAPNVPFEQLNSSRGINRFDNQPRSRGGRGNQDRSARAEKLGLADDYIATLPERLAYHLQEVARWSEEVHFVGMPTAHDTDEATIPLAFDVPRRFRPLDKPENQTGEEELVSRKRHILLLGDPGSGKTTTLKRLARALLTQDSGSVIQYQYPVFLALKDLPPATTIAEALAERLGVKIPAEASAQIEHTFPSVKPPVVDVPRAVHFVLDKSEAVLLLDGLDEVDVELRSRIIGEIESFGRHILQGKIIVTCRSGAYGHQLSGFDILEICPLSISQINSVAQRWLGTDAGLFIELLRDLPYHDVCTRPLMVCQLMTLYKRYGRLPEQPAEVYRRTVRLFLEDWDSERRIIRKSKYAGFDPERKSEFLSMLAYYLTCQIKTKTFFRSDLVTSYKAIHKSFGLPESEADQVAAELETHTGIIVATSMAYEFSHLSLQEYLCAEYLVKIADTRTAAAVCRRISGAARGCCSAVLRSNRLARLCCSQERHPVYQRERL
jgi:hypothetical protein